MPESDLDFVVRMASVRDPVVHEVATRLAVAMSDDMLASPPTREIGLMRPDYGYQKPKAAGFDWGWNQFTDDLEYVPELRWPQSIRVFDMMRTDAQLSGLYRAMTYPIRRFKFMIKPNGSREEVYMGIANDMNLDVEGQDPRPRGRQKRRFSFNNFLYHALLSLIYGHMFFEQYGEYGPDGLWHLRKLAPRMPRTIMEINVAPDGGLISIRQNLQRFGKTAGYGGWMPEPIPVGSIVAFPWEMEGANWVGRSMMRDCFKNWMIKDRLMRVDAINHERAGGVPIAEAPSGASPHEMERLNQLAQNFKVGETSGGSVPQGTNFTLHKIGAGTDVINSIKYHDESMSRMFLHMFIQLGQTETGSRSLGLSFIEYAFIAQKAIASWFVDITNAHVIEDWVDWNYGEDEPIPLLNYVVEEEDEHLAVTELVALIGAGAITPDEELEDTLRTRYHLPRRIIPKDLAGVAAEAARREYLTLCVRNDIKYGLEWREDARTMKVGYKSPFYSIGRGVRRAVTAR